MGESFLKPQVRWRVPTLHGVNRDILSRSFVIFAPLFSLLVVAQIRGHGAGSSPPRPTMVRALHFYCEKISAFSSLVESRRIVLTHDRRSQQLILFYYYYYFFINKFKISPRRNSNSRTNTKSIRGLPLVHRGDRLKPEYRTVYHRC